MGRRARSGLLIGLLLAAGAIPSALAAGTPQRSSRHPSRAAKGCHRTRHHGCPPHRHTEPAVHRPGTPTPPQPSSGTSAEGPTRPGQATSPSLAPGAAGTTPGSGSEPAPGGPPAAPAAAAHVEVTAEDTQAFRFVLSRASVPAGRVIIEFVNHGQDEHNMHVLEAGEGTEDGAIPNTPPTAHPSLSLQLRHGSYTFFCSIPGHEAAGMKATLLVN